MVKSKIFPFLKQSLAFFSYKHLATLSAVSYLLRAVILGQVASNFFRLLWLDVAVLPFRAALNGNLVCHSKTLPTIQGASAKT